MGIKEKIDSAPTSPGIYLFKDKRGDVIYIGKAASVKKRLKSHFSKDSGPRQKMLMENASDVDFILTPDESTALLLEAALIKKYKPRCNVLLKDDKSYLRLKLTVNEEYPRLFLTRRIKGDGALYFGPYTNAKLLRKALNLMRRIFPLRTCPRFPKKTCLNFHIGQCLAPCVNNCKKDEYLKVVEELRLFLDGEQDELLRFIAGQMKIASDEKDYEKAARLRDRVKALSLVSENIFDTGPAQTESQGKKTRFYPTEQVEQLRSVLNLSRVPYIIEAFDVSNIGGKDAVGSMVYFKNGKPDKSQYRKFRIRTVKAIDDYSMMREIVSRRYSYLISKKLDLPDLIIIDGGKGHLAAAKKELHKLKLWQVPTISIAKGLEKIYISEDKEPIILGKFESALLLVQRIRDEAHRFAIGYHRLLRRKETGASELDNIKSIGPRKKANLIRYFGTLDEIKMADVEDLKRVEFINEKEAKAIYDYFQK
ncbi:MAG: excinuclease ABC subunit UvrC [Candidatus Omnitrophota bacterium]